MAKSEHTLFEIDTAHDHYAVVESEYEGRPARVLFSGTRRAAQSGIGLDDNADLLFDYNQRILELANGLYPKHILVIGGGAFSLPMALRAALPDAIVDVVELDEGLLPIAQQFFGLTLDDQLHVSFGDGRDYVANTKNMYDLIVIDVFSELSIPPQFLTLQFISLLRTKLHTGGCVAMNIIASYQGRNAGLIKSQVAAYGQVFDQLQIFPAGYGLTSWLPQNLVIVAQRSPVQTLKHYMRYAPIDSVETSADDLYYDDEV